MVGGLIMAHGDDDGLRVPPELAPIQVVVLAVRDEGDCITRCRVIADDLRRAGLRVQLDDKADVSMGRRATDWELKGIPVRLEVGPRDLADEQATLVRRILAGAATAEGFERKISVGLEDLVVTVTQELGRQQVALLATRRRPDERIERPTSPPAPRPSRRPSTDGLVCRGTPSAKTGRPSSRRAVSRSGASTRADGSLPEADTRGRSRRDRRPAY